MQVEIPNFIKVFIAKEFWTFAKTMPQIPHWHVVRGNCDDETFAKFVSFIYSNGQVRAWHDREFTYLDIDNFTYWTMGNPIDETTIINRAKIDKSPHLPT